MNDPSSPNYVTPGAPPATLNEVGLAGRAVMGRFPLAYTYEPPGQTESSMSDLSEQRAPNPEGPAPKRGAFGQPAKLGPLAAAVRLTRDPDGHYSYKPRVGLILGAQELKEEPPGYRSACYHTDVMLNSWVAHAIERAKLRRCKPMIARLKKELGEKIARSQQQQADEFRRLLHDAHHADAGDGDDWAGISYAGPRAARDLAVDIEIWNALQ